jgi:uncharacterized membrane protein HdeD (DUF308 family)
MIQQRARNWWLVGLRGFLSVLFGVLALAVPWTTLNVLIIFFGAYALVDGISALVAALAGPPGTRRGPLILEAFCGIVAGFIAFFWPGAWALGFAFLMAGWALVTGVFEILAAFRMEGEGASRVWLGLAGVASVVFGILVAVNPASGLFFFILVLGIYAIIFGGTLLILAYRLRRMRGTGRGGNAIWTSGSGGGLSAAP